MDQRASLYAQRRGLRIDRRLGYTKDGTVFSTIVAKPYLLDFADAYRDESPDFPDEVIEHWHAQKIEELGVERWDQAQLVWRRYAVPTASTCST
ncbi:MAG: hypothetical protein C4547_13085 [Phycisphaerales bacterium]|nr:MAG: hypothetical protein C4547_13085 [Phycisphaerales bacterium]